MISSDSVSVVLGGIGLVLDAYAYVAGTGCNCMRVPDTGCLRLWY